MAYTRIAKKPKTTMGGQRDADKRLWPIFSVFIRLRDSNENGYVQCFTCGAWRYWRDVDCGHGLSRAHMATKYAEKNNHAQCKKCNMPPNNGRPIQYKQEMDKRYGTGTWDMFEVLSKTVCKWGKFEFEMMAIHFWHEIQRLHATKKNLKESLSDLQKLLKIKF